MRTLTEGEEMEAWKRKTGVLMRGLKAMMRKMEALRRKMLGELGEEVGMEALIEWGCHNVKNLNDDKKNFWFADLYAEKGKKRFVISVKARNKFQKDGKTLNTHYNITRKHKEEAEAAYKAEARWLVVQFDSSTYTIYFGTLDELKMKNSVPIKKCACEEERCVSEETKCICEEKRCVCRKVGICLVKDRRHYINFDFLTNVKK